MHSNSTTGRFSAMADTVAAAEMAQPLSEANLAEHVSMRTTDNLFEECHIRQEGFQLFDRACCASIHECNSERRVESDGEPIDFETRMERVTRQYRAPGASSATVMDRFAFVSPQNEPFGPDATNALKSWHIDVGSLEAAKLRSDAARTVAVLETPSESDSTKAVTSDTSSDSDNNCVEAVEVDSENDNGYDRPEDMSSRIRNTVTRCPIQGRDRRKRVPRLRREANDTANKRQRVEQG